MDTAARRRCSGGDWPLEWARKPLLLRFGWLGGGIVRALHVVHAHSLHHGALEGSRIDANPLKFCFDTDLSKDRHGRKAVTVAPANDVHVKAWLRSIDGVSDGDLARRLGITDRQVRRIRKGKVSEARLREHAKADPEFNKDDCRPHPMMVRAALLLLGVAADSADGLSRIAAYGIKVGAQHEANRWPVSGQHHVFIRLSAFPGVAAPRGAPRPA